MSNSKRNAPTTIVGALHNFDSNTTKKSSITEKYINTILPKFLAHEVYAELENIIPNNSNQYLWGLHPIGGLK